MSIVLAGVDGSAVSRDCLRAAVVLAELLAAAPEAVYVGAAAPPELLRLAAATGVRLNCRPGRAGAALVEALGAPEVAMGVLGSSGAGDTKVPQGRTAAAVMSASDKPLLIVPPGSFPPAQRRLHRVLVPLDGRRESAQAVVPVLRQLAGAGLELVVVHVDDEDSIPSFSDAIAHETEGYAREFLMRYCPGAPNASLELRLGVPTDEILGVVGQVAPQLLAIGWPQSPGPARGMVARDLLNRSPIPLLLLSVGSGGAVFNS